MKKFVAGMLAGLMAMSGTLVFADKIEAVFGKVNLVVNGVDIDTETLLYNDRTYFPIESLGKSLGYEVNYDKETKTAYIGEIPDGAVKTSKPAEVVANGFYIDYPGVPDFGTYAGIELYKMETKSNATAYAYKGDFSKEKIAGYEKLLKDNGLKFTKEIDRVKILKNDTNSVMYKNVTEDDFGINGVAIIVSKL